MNPEQKEFMSLQMPPARLSQQQAAWYLGFQFHDIPVLSAAGLLKPLGRPMPNGLKYFATVELQRLREDTKWLARASDAITAHWRRKNDTTAPRKPERPTRQRELLNATFIGSSA